MRLRRKSLQRLAEAATDYVRQKADAQPQATQDAAAAIVAGGGVLVVSIAMSPAGVMVDARAVQKDGPSIELGGDMVAAGNRAAAIRLR